MLHENFPTTCAGLHTTCCMRYSNRELEPPLRTLSDFPGTGRQTGPFPESQVHFATNGRYPGDTFWAVPRRCHRGRIAAGRSSRLVARRVPFVMCAVFRRISAHLSRWNGRELLEPRPKWRPDGPGRRLRRRYGSGWEVDAARRKAWRHLARPSAMNLPTRRCQAQYDAF